jgi:hypothetical protein
MPDLTIKDLDIKYLFNEFPLTTFGMANERRLKSCPDLIEGFISDTSGQYDLLNLYDSSSDNTTMINKLLNYRLGNTVVLTDVVYENLNYTLSKLIYVYLNLMINGVLTDFDTTDSISSENSLIDSLFELYILNESHKLVKTWKNFLSSDVIELRPFRRKVTVDETIIRNGSFTIYDNLPHDTNKMYFYKNGELEDKSKFSWESGDNHLKVFVNSTGTSGLNIKLNDILIMDSYLSVNTLIPSETV